jgi:hypothetical protein
MILHLLAYLLLVSLIVSLILGRFHHFFNPITVVFESENVTPPTTAYQVNPEVLISKCSNIHVIIFTNVNPLASHGVGSIAGQEQTPTGTPPTTDQEAALLHNPSICWYIVTVGRQVGVFTHW